MGQHPQLVPVSLVLGCLVELLVHPTVPMLLTSYGPLFTIAILKKKEKKNFLS